MKKNCLNEKTVLSCLLLSTMLLCGGCLVLGPDYKAPETAMPQGWSIKPDKGLNPERSSPEALSRWWVVFGDPVLTELMEKARTGSLDVRQAEARLHQARAQRGVTKADSFPSLSAGASSSRTRTREDNSEGTTRNLFSNSLDASWELDLFGKKRRSLEAADAALKASEEDHNDVLVTLFAEVALNYVEMRSLQERLFLAEESLKIQSETCDLTRWRHEAGLTTQMDLDQSTLSLEQNRAEIPNFQTSLTQAKNRLAILLGQEPGTLDKALNRVASIPVASESIAVGIPADVLRQRPDVRRAERKLAAQTAKIGVAKASQYPSFNLLGSIGLESLKLGNLYSAGTETSRAAANAAWTLFDFGRIRKNIEIQTALQEESLAFYEAAILTALEDVENALASYVSEQARQGALKNALKSGESAFVLARDQYSSGLTDFQSVLNTQKSLLSARDQLAVSNANRTGNVIRLYKALGGGWTPAASKPEDKKQGDQQ